MSAIKLKQEPKDYTLLVETLSYSYNYFKENEKRIVEYGVETECPIKYKNEAVSIKKVLTQLGVIALAKGAIERDTLKSLFPEYEENQEEDLKSITRAEARIMDIFSIPETQDIITKMEKFMVEDKRNLVVPQQGGSQC